MLLLRSETYLVLWHNFTMGPFYKDIFYVIPFSQIIQKKRSLWPTISEFSHFLPVIYLFQFVLLALWPVKDNPYKPVPGGKNSISA